MHNEKLNTPKGVGVGSLFSGLIREIIPVTPSTIKSLNKVIDDKSMKIMGKTLQEEATNTAVDNTLDFLNNKKINKSKKNQLKKIAKNILTAGKHKKLKVKKNTLSTTNKKKALSLSQSKKTPKKKVKSCHKKKIKTKKRSKKEKIIDR